MKDLNNKLTKVKNFKCPVYFKETSVKYKDSKLIIQIIYSKRHSNYFKCRLLNNKAKIKLLLIPFMMIEFLLQIKYIGKFI